MGLADGWGFDEIWWGGAGSFGGSEMWCFGFVKMAGDSGEAVVTLGGAWGL